MDNAKDPVQLLISKLKRNEPLTDIESALAAQLLDDAYVEQSSDRFCPHNYPSNIISQIFGTDIYVSASDKEMCDKLKIALATLDEIDQKALQLRYEDGLTLEKVGLAIKKSPEYTRRIIVRALRRLRTPSRSRILTGDPELKAMCDKAREAYERTISELNQKTEEAEQLIRSIIKESSNKDALKSSNGLTKAVMSIKIGDMNLSSRPYNCLWRAGIETVEDLCSHTETSLSRIRNMGKKSLCEITTWLDEHGLSLAKKNKT